MLRQKEDPDGEPRFRMLETIREYALEHLTNQPDAYDLHQAYARYYLQFALEAETGMVGECVSEWLDRLDDESSNLTAALTWSAKNNPLLELQLVNALARFWILRGQLQTGDAWLGEALKRGDSEASKERNVTLRWAAYFRSMLGDPVGTATLSREWLESARELGDRESEGEALYRLGELHVETGDLQHGRELIGEGLQISRDLGAADLTAKLLGGLGCAALEDGDTASALTLFEEAVSLHRSGGSRHNVAVSLGRLATTRLETASQIRLRRRYVRRSKSSVSSRTIGKSASSWRDLRIWSQPKTLRLR